MARIFMSYRRQDSGTFTGRIHDQLKTSFGGNNVFRDVYNIPAGSDFRSVLNEEIGKCDICLVIIGPHWVNITSLPGNRRLDDPNDFVRVEVEAALNNPKVLVVPVLVDGANMPTAEELPVSLKQLAYRNAVKVRTDPDFPHDMEILIRQLRRSKHQPVSRILWPVLVFALLLFAGLALFSGIKFPWSNIPASIPIGTENPPTTVNAIVLIEPTLTIQPVEITETPTSIPIVEPVGPGEIMVLVAQIEQTGEITRVIINDLVRRFEDELPVAADIRNVSIREYRDVIRTKEEASQIAEQTQAVILIWGDYDNDTARITVQLGSLTSRPNLLIDRDTLDRTITVRVKMMDEHEETLAYQVLTALLSLHSAENNFVEAIRLIMALDHLDGTSPEIIGNSVSAHIHKASQVFLSNKELAIEETKQAIELDANNPLLYLFRGLLYQETGMYAQSDVDSNAALGLAPKGWITPYYVKGIESLIRNDPANGIRAYSEIISARPNDWLPYNQRGYLYIFAGQKELELGNAEQKMGNIEKSKEHFILAQEYYILAQENIEKSIELGPEAEWPYMWATLIALRQGRINDVPALLQNISQTKQSDSIKKLMATMYGETNATLLGASMSTMEQLSKRQYIFAIQNADAVLTAMPTYVEMYLLKGLSYCNLGDYQNAADAYTQGLTMDSSFTVLYLLRAEVLREMGMTEEASKDETLVQGNILLYENLSNYLAAAKSEQSPCKQLIPSR